MKQALGWVLVGLAVVAVAVAAVLWYFSAPRLPASVRSLSAGRNTTSYVAPGIIVQFEMRGPNDIQVRYF
ncbi:hypothetical protein [Deinococcus sp.]|uniref:hypothetical protein n=1 Tax=Deinococcus sp. TaxID=47478 RepID=UPI003B59EB00